MLSQEDGDARFWLKRGGTSIREKTFLKKRAAQKATSPGPTTTAPPHDPSTYDGIHAHFLLSEEDIKPVCGFDQFNPAIDVKEEEISANEESDGASSSASYSEGLVRRVGKRQMRRGSTCMKCKQVFNYDARKEWEMRVNHALGHTPYKTFHCLLCDFSTYDGQDLYTHHQEMHKFGGTVMLHPACDNDKDRVQLEQIVHDCFPGARLKFMGVKERKLNNRRRGIERYLVTFDVISPHALAKRRKTTVRCNRCRQFFSNSVWSEQCLHALTHAEFSQLKCSICSMKMVSPDDFHAHAQKEHRGKAELIHKPMEDLTPQETARVEQLVCEIFSPSKAMTISKKRSVNERKIRCKKCKCYTGMDWTSKLEHALLHTDVGESKCSDCDRRFEETGDFLYHNLLAHQAKANLTTKSLSELSREDVAKVEEAVLTLFNDVLTVARKVEAEQDGKIAPKKVVRKRKRAPAAGGKKRKTKQFLDVDSDEESDNE